MQPPSPALLRALRRLATSPLRSQTHPNAIPKSPSLHHPSPQHRPLSTSSPCRRAADGRLYNRPSATSIGAPRTPGLAPKSKDRGPQSKEDTQTDFGAMNVLANTPPPATAIDACLDDGFHLSNGVKITGGSGVLLVGGEAFAWRPWEERRQQQQQQQQPQGGEKMDAGTQVELRRAMVNKRFQFDVPQRAWGLLDVVWPKPELLIVGVGAQMLPLSKETKEHINGLGIRVDVLDTRNASAQFNLLATERGVGVVAAAMLPMGFRGMA